MSDERLPKFRQRRPSISAAKGVIATRARKGREKLRSVFGSPPDWINACASVGLLFLGIVTLWGTLRISDIEEYFRSEISFRNEQLRSAEVDLRNVQAQTIVLNRDLETARRSLDDLNDERVLLQVDANVLKNHSMTLTTENEKLSETIQQATQDRLALRSEIQILEEIENTLKTENASISAKSSALGKEVAMRDLSSRLGRADWANLGDMPGLAGESEEARIRDRDEFNPGLELIEKLHLSYLSNPPENEYANIIFSSFRQRCEPILNNIVRIGSYKNPRPVRETFPGLQQPDKPFLTVAERDAWLQRYNAAFADYEEKQKLYFAEAQSRFEARTKARKEVRNILYICVANIIGASTHEY